MANFSNQLMENKSYVKSNEMISAKYKSTLLENQVMAIALTRIEENHEDRDAPLEARLYPGELKKLVSDDTHIYRDLKSLAKTITGHTMFLEDGRGNFKAFSVVPNADYQDGVFIIKFNQVLKDHLLGMDKNFTTLELSMMTNFSRNSSFRIYELLKKDLFRSRPGVNNGRVDVEYNLFEFRFLIGIANSDNVYVQNKIKTMTVVDWEELYRVLEKNGSRSDIKFKTTDKLQRDCIRPAQEELEKKSDIRFDYELVRVGRPYKKIVFHIYPNVPQDEEELIVRQKYVEKISGKDRQYEIPMDMNEETKKLYDDYVGHNELDKEDLDFLLKTSKFNVKDVIAAIKYTDEQSEVNNYMGYLVRCIQDRYFESGQVEVVKGSHEYAVGLKELRQQANSEETKKRVWESTKRKDDFGAFLSYEENVRELSFMELDEILQPADAVAEYIEWKKAGSPTVIVDGSAGA
ncbi:MAG: replication initiation protein [Lachnospiraceae bacterium]|nr:replication initiation protein [Lachnospiraceae bacterium]